MSIRKSSAQFYFTTYTTELTERLHPKQSDNSYYVKTDRKNVLTEFQHYTDRVAHKQRIISKQYLNLPI